MKTPMTQVMQKSYFVFAIFIFGIAFVFASSPLQSNYTQEKDGLVVYLGIVPAEMLIGVDSQSMHGGVPEKGLHRMHLALAIFDKKSGRRLTDAIVKARIVATGQDTGLKLLDAMRWKDQLVYGNYFSLSAAGPFSIKVQVKTPKHEKPVEFTFQYDVAHV